nr:MAG TPA: putative endoribonuclease [Caudoviricetes sp.]
MGKFPEPPRKIPTPPKPLKPLSAEDIETMARNAAAIGVASTIDVSKVKGVRPMTDMWRINMLIPRDMEERIVNLRKQDEYCRMSFSRIIRELIIKGLNEVEKEDK